MATACLRRGDFLAELKNVPIVVANGEFAHAIFEILNGIDDGNFVAKFLPNRIHILGLKIKSAGESRLVKRKMLIGERSMISAVLHWSAAQPSVRSPQQNPRTSE
jgi:hypothetical protein